MPMRHSDGPKATISRGAILKQDLRSGCRRSTTTPKRKVRNQVKNCDKDIRAYHDERVRLTENQKKKLRDRRDANRDRLRRGLKKNADPAPVKSVIQGSYAMWHRHPRAGGAPTTSTTA